MKLKFIGLCTNVCEYYKIKKLDLLIDNNTDLNNKDGYAIFDIVAPTIDNIKDIVNIIDNDVKNWITLHNCYVDSNLKVDDIIAISQL